MKDKKLCLTIIISFGIALLITLPNIIIGKGVFTLIADLNLQQIPFLTSINRSIRTGNFFWTWSNDFGSNIIGTFSFYNLFSPFNIMTYVFNPEFVKYLIGPIFILKYVVASVTSYLFLKRYVSNKNYAVLGAILYAFSGYQLTNILFYHFHDVVALFPLLLYSFDKLIYEKKKSYFAIVLFINVITNWFFVIGEVIFLVMYYFIKLLSREIKFDKTTFIRIIIEGLIGILLASFILIPTLYFTSGNPRLSNSWSFISMIKYSGSQYFELIRSLISPAQNMAFRSIISKSNYGSVELYLPVVGIIFVIPYLIKHIKRSESLLVIILLLFAFVPILNSSFILFQVTYYARWFYILILMLVLVTIKSLDENLNINSGVIVTIALIIAEIIYISYTYFKKNILLLFDEKYLIIIIVMTFVSVITVMLIYQIKKEKTRIISLFISVIVFVGIWGNYTIYKYKFSKIYYDKGINDYYNLYSELNNYKKYRGNATSNCKLNLGYIGQNNNLFSWNSNTSNTTFEFLDSIGIQRGIMTVIDARDKKLNSFLGVEYIISCSNEDLSKYGYEYKETINDMNIYNNKGEDVNIVHEINNYVNVNKFNKLDVKKRKEYIYSSIILNDYQIKKYKKIINNKGKAFNSKFSFTNNGFDVDIKSDHDTFALIIVPYDEGWSAYNNGKKIDVEKVDNGLVGIPIHKGNNKIHFSYLPKGFIVGAIVSIMSFITYIILKIFESRKYRNTN